MSTTTTEQANPKAIIYTLNKCIEVCTDSEKGHAMAAADARAPALKILLQEKAKERVDFVLELQAAIQKLGAIPKNEGTVKGAVRRGWMEARLALESRTDRVIIEEWTHAEQAALKGYERAFVQTPIDSLPKEVRMMVQRQYAAIEASLGDARRRLALH